MVAVLVVRSFFCFFWPRGRFCLLVRSTASKAPAGRGDWVGSRVAREVWDEHEGRRGGWVGGC